MNNFWKKSLQRARKLPMEELKRHASVSLNNRHACYDCFCCACALILRENQTGKPCYDPSEEFYALLTILFGFGSPVTFDQFNDARVQILRSPNAWRLQGYFGITSCFAVIFAPSTH